MMRIVSGIAMSFTASHRPSPRAITLAIRLRTISVMRGSSSFTRCAVKAFSISFRMRVWYGGSDMIASGK